MSEVGSVLHALSCGNASCQCQRSERAEHGLTHCPAHQDRNPSLNLEERDGRLVWRCHAGCSQEAVLVALQERDLLGQRNGKHPEPKPVIGPRTRRKTLEAMSREKAAQGALRERIWEIRDAAGELVALHVRWEYPEREKELAWATPDRLVGLGGLPTRELPLYGSELLAGKPGAPVALVEGEKAADALRGAGVLALGTVCGASVTPALEALEPLRGRSKVVLWPDADKAGHQHMAKIAKLLRELGVPVFLVDWPEAPAKGDAADFLASHGREELRALLQAAQPLQEAPAPAEETPVAATGVEMRLKVMTTDPRTFLLDFVGLGQVSLAGGQLQRWYSVQGQCIEQLHRIPAWAPRNAHHWESILADLLNDAEIVEPPPELTIEGRVLAQLRRFCDHALEIRDALVKGTPWLDVSRGLYVFRLSDFLSLVKWADPDLKRPDVVDALRELGGGLDDAITRPQAWCIAQERVNEPEEEESDG